MASDMLQQEPGLLMIFDLDGTLFRSESVTVPAVLSTFHDYGVSPPPEVDIRSYFGKPHAEFHTWLKTISPPDKTAAMIREIDRRELSNVTTHGSLYDGVLTVLDHLLTLSMTLALCTNGEKTYVSTVIDSHDLRSRFHRIRHRISSIDSKPKMVGEIVTNIGFRHGFMVGDRKDDMEAAKQNGLLAIGAAYGFGSPSELRSADIIIKDITSLPVILDSYIKT